MIREVKNISPLEFEILVREEVSTSLAAHGFQFREPFHLYKNELVPFVRERHGLEENIEFCRRSYGVEEMSASVEDDEIESPRDSGQGRFWASRHYLGVQIVTNYTHADLLRTGKIGWSNTGEDWWYFKDEAELRRCLHDEILPLILTVGLQKFDDRLEDIQAEHATQTAV